MISRHSIMCLMVALSSSLVSCVLEDGDKCINEGAVECIGEFWGPKERICIDGHWREQTCDVLLPYCIDNKCVMCIDGQAACVEGIPESLNFCIDGAWVTTKCQPGRMCESGVCPVDMRPCESSSDLCVEDKVRRHCTKGAIPTIIDCIGETHCEEGFCK